LLYTDLHFISPSHIQRACYMFLRITFCTVSRFCLLKRQTSWGDALECGGWKACTLPATASGAYGPYRRYATRLSRHSVVSVPRFSKPLRLAVKVFQNELCRNVCSVLLERR
jgi:hypothetical protein